MDRLREAWRRAVTAELCWTGPDGVPEAIAVTPVLRGTGPAATVCAALPYARAAELASLRAAGAAVFAVTDSRSLPGDTASEATPRGAPGAATSGRPPADEGRTGEAWDKTATASSPRAGVAGSGAVRIIDDLDGELFADELLDQELVKYPPSRTLADSMLLRRENWWWLPRIVVELTGPAAGAGEPYETHLPARTNPARHGLLVTAPTGNPDMPGDPPTRGIPELRSVDLEARAASTHTARPDTARPDTAVDARFSDVTGLRDLTGAPLLPSTPGGGLVFGYDYTMPDLERWEAWSLAGTTDDGQLAVDVRTGSPGEDLRTLGLLARTRRQRALAKACRAGLRAAERHPQPAP